MCSGKNNDDSNNDHNDEKGAQGQGRDVQALGSGHIALGPNHDSHHFTVPKPYGAGDCH